MSLHMIIFIWKHSVFWFLYDNGLRHERVKGSCRCFNVRVPIQKYLPDFSFVVDNFLDGK